MAFKHPESAILKQPHKIEGTMEEARQSFYELAKDRVRYFNHQEFIDWLSEVFGQEPSKTKTAYEKSPIAAWSDTKIKHNEDEGGECEKYVSCLEIGVDTSKYDINGENYKDIMPFTIEHDIYESWLRSKKGRLEQKEFSQENRAYHLLALRREFLLAEQAGKAERLFEWRMMIDPNKEAEYRSAWENAKKKMRKK